MIALLLALGSGPRRTAWQPEAHPPYNNSVLPSCCQCLIVLIIDLLIALGSVLVEPFGTDFADHPLGGFCDTIEMQVRVTAVAHARTPGGAATSTL